MKKLILNAVILSGGLCGSGAMADCYLPNLSNPAAICQLNSQYLRNFYSTSVAIEDGPYASSANSPYFNSSYDPEKAYNYHVTCASEYRLSDVKIIAGRQITGAQVSGRFELTGGSLEGGNRMFQMWITYQNNGQHVKSVSYITREICSNGQWLPVDFRPDYTAKELFINYYHFN